MSDDGRSALCSGCGNACAYFQSVREGDEWWHIQCRQSFEIERLKVSHARLEKDLSGVRANAEAEIEVLRGRLDEVRTQRDAAFWGNNALHAELETERKDNAEAAEELGVAWAQLRSDHTHDPEDEGTLAEEIAALQRVWHDAERERDEAMALVGEAIKASARYVFDAEKAEAERDDALARVKQWEDKEAKRGSCCADMEARAMDLEARSASALDRLTRRPVHYLSWRALAKAADDTIAILGGRKVEQAMCDACDHPWSKHDAEDGCQADCYCPHAPPLEKKS